MRSVFIEAENISVNLSKGGRITNFFYQYIT